MASKRASLPVSSVSPARIKSARQPIGQAGSNRPSKIACSLESLPARRQANELASLSSRLCLLDRLWQASFSSLGGSGLRMELVVVVSGASRRAEPAKRKAGARRALAAAPDRQQPEAASKAKAKCTNSIDWHPRKHVRLGARQWTITGDVQWRASSSHGRILNIVGLAASATLQAQNPLLVCIYHPRSAFDSAHWLANTLKVSQDGIER